MDCSRAYLNAKVPALKVVNRILYSTKIRASKIILSILIRMLLVFPVLMM